MSHNCNCHGAKGKLTKTEVGVLERPIYAPGLVLRDSDLTSAVDYTQALNRMLFKHLFGCGVVCGLEVKAVKDCELKIEISPGLALDDCGDAVHLAKPVSFIFDEQERDNFIRSLESDKDDGGRKKAWIVLCGREKLCAPRALVCDADEFDGVPQMTRARAMAEVSLVTTRPKCICVHQEVKTGKYKEGDAEKDCFDPYPFDCADDCGCGSACSCGCCVLLGAVVFEDGKDPVATHLGVRRIAKPVLMQDSKRCPEPEREAVEEEPKAEQEQPVKEKTEKAKAAISAVKTPAA